MLFVVHAFATGGLVSVILQSGHRILGRLEMEPEEWRGFRRLLGSGVVGASTDNVNMRLIDEV